MPGSIAESQHGRRGGGWLPKGHDPGATLPPPASTQEKSAGTCSTCGRSKDAHSGKVCPPCGHPIEHCDDEHQAACWEGRARMARARQAALADHGHAGTVNGAGILAPLDTVDLEALRRHP